MGQYAEFIITLLSSMVLIAFSVAILRMILGILKKSGYNISSILVACAFLTSPYIVVSANVIGYFDQMIILLTFVACLSVLKGRSWVAAIILSIGILTHESILIVGLPSVLFIAILSRLRDAKNSTHADLSVTSTARCLLPFILPLLVFAFLFFYQSYFLDAESIKASLTEHISRFDFVRLDMNNFVPGAYTTSILHYLDIQGSRIATTIYAPQYMARVFPTLILLLMMAWSILRQCRHAKMLFVMATAISLLPLAMHIVAWDAGRIWTYPLIIALFAVWGLSETHPDRGVNINSTLFDISCLMIILANIFSISPLLDGVTERYDNEIRILYYLPTLIILGMIFTKNYRRIKN